MDETMKAIFRRAAPYAKDALNLPVADVEAAIPFYEKTFGFRVLSRHEEPHRRAVLARDDIQIGLAENGGDPTQEGCFFEVENLGAAFAEVKGTPPSESSFETQNFYGVTYRSFFAVAPDGLCYLIGERVRE